jgi:glycerophosphoryl diester phosphodiesterase
MKKIILIFIIIFQLVFIFSKEITPTKYIAHAGGGINNITYSNCLEALDLNYKLGHRIFEIDFSWTSDNKLIALHDWKKGYAKLFNETINTPLDFNTIINKKMINNYTILTLSLISEWLKKHPDAYIVTDIKDKNIEGLKYIADNFKEDISRYIPQIYFTKEYQEVKKIGFKNIILTLYLNKESIEKLTKFVDSNKLFALTTYLGKRDSSKILQIMEERNIFVYVHTYNDKKFVDKILKTSVDGIYTDFLYE